MASLPQNIPQMPIMIISKGPNEKTVQYASEPLSLGTLFSLNPLNEVLTSSKIPLNEIFFSTG